jgi:hypothetical protein
VRQVGAFAAAWTLGSAATFAAAGVTALTLHEAAGWGGLVAADHQDLPQMPAAPGTILPVGRVVAALAELAGMTLLAAESAPPIHALAARDEEGATRLFVANLGTESRQVTLRHGWEAARVGEVSLLTGDDAGGAHWVATTITGSGMALPPSAVARLVIRAA